MHYTQATHLLDSLRKNSDQLRGVLQKKIHMYELVYMSYQEIKAEFGKLPQDAESASRLEFEALLKGSGKVNAYDLSNEMKNVMFADVGIYRNEKDMQSALEKVRELFY